MAVTRPVDSNTLPSLHPFNPQGMKKEGLIAKTVEAYEIAIGIIGCLGLAFALTTGGLGFFGVIGVVCTVKCVSIGLLVTLATWFPLNYFRNKNQLSQEDAQAYKQQIQRIIQQVRALHQEGRELFEIETYSQERLPQGQENVWEFIFRNQLITHQEMSGLYQKMMDSKTINMLSRVQWYEKLEHARRNVGAVANEYKFGSPGEYKRRWAEETKGLPFISDERDVEGNRLRSIVNSYGAQDPSGLGIPSFSYLKLYEIVNQDEYDVLEGLVKDFCQARGSGKSLDVIVQEVNFRYGCFREQHYPSSSLS